MPDLHAREQICQAVAARILAGATIPAQVGRPYPLPRFEVTTALVDWLTEDVQERRAMGQPVLQDRRLAVQVSIQVKAAGDLEDRSVSLSMASLAVERALYNLNLAGVSAWVLRNAQKLLDDAGEAPAADVQLTYEASYRTRANHPEIIIP